MWLYECDADWHILFFDLSIALPLVTFVYTLRVLFDAPRPIHGALGECERRTEAECARSRDARPLATLSLVTASGIA